MGMTDRFRQAVTPQVPPAFIPPMEPVAHSVAPSAYRAMTASASKIDLRDPDELNNMRYRVYQEWQHDAWGYYDAIGEIKYGFGMLASVMSRIRLYSAFNLDPDSVPQSTLDYRRRMEKLSEKENAKDDALEMKMPEGIDLDIMEYMEELVADLATGPGGLSSFLRSFALNMSVPGDCYLIRIGEEWTIKSSSEIVVHADGEIYLRRQRRAEGTAVTSNGTTVGDIKLPKTTELVRIWREHPRYSEEPESSMLGLREACDELLTLQRMIRAVARSNMNAGLLFIPDTLRAAGSSVAEDQAAEEELGEELLATFYDNMVTPITDETNAATVFPTLIVGPGEAGKDIKYIEINRKVDQFLTERCDRALERVLQGIDMPKDFVTGLANVRYTNAKNIDESLYKTHIEPLVLMLVDGLNTGYFIPKLKKKFGRRLDKRTLRKLTVWYDPSEIVTRADPAESANKGFDNFALSGDAWRQAHGFSDTDAPGEEEIAMRLLQKASLPPETITAFVNHVLPQIVKKQRDEALSKNPGGFPESANQQLSTQKDGPYYTPPGQPPLEIEETPTTGGPQVGDPASILADADDDETAIAAAVVARSRNRSRLYNKPYQDTDMQERFRTIAEGAVRNFDMTMQEFDVATITPTQPEIRSETSGSGAGAKDLPPIVVKYQGTDYLLDGHHRAMSNPKIVAAYVDLENLKTTVGKVQ